MRFILAFGLLALCPLVALRAEEPGSRLKLGEAATSKWRFGLVVKAPPGAVNGIVATSAKASSPHPAWPWWLLLAVAALALIVLLVLLWRRRSKDEGQAPATVD